MITAIIYDILSISTKIESVVDDKYFHMLAPLDTEGSFITYLLMGCTPIYTKTKHAVINDFQIQFEVVSDKVDSVVDISAVLLKTLEDSRQTIHLGHKIESVQLTNMKEGIGDDLVPFRLLDFNFSISAV